MADPQSVTIEIQKDEAVVLLGLLSRLNDEDRGDLFAHPSEHRVLWTVQYALEKQFTEPIDQDLLQAARDRVQRRAQ